MSLGRLRRNRWISADSKLVPATSAGSLASDSFRIQSSFSIRFLQVFSLLLLGCFARTTLLAAVTTHSNQNFDQKQTLVIDGLGKGTVELDGPWQFQTGDDLAWSAPDFDDSHWEQIDGLKSWGIQSHPSYTGYAWYRRRLQLSLAPGAPSDLTLMMRHVDDAYEIYWNGLLVGTNGAFPPNPKWFNDQAPQTFGLGPIRSGVLAVRVWKAPLLSYDDGSAGGFQFAPILGSPEAVAAAKASLDYHWLRGRQFTFGLDGLYALVALLCLLGWARDRSQWLLFWMAGFSLAPLAILVLDGLRFLWPFNLSLGLQQPLYSLEDLSLWFMLMWLLQLQELRLVTRITRIAAMINVAATTLDGIVEAVGWGSGVNRQLQLVDGALTAIWTLTETLPLVLVTIAVVRHRRLGTARWLVASFAFLTVMMSVVQVSSSQGSRFTHWTLPERISAPLFSLNGNPISPYTLFRTLLVVALIYAVYRYSAETRQRQGELEQEFQNARELQKVLIPETLPSVPGFAFTSAYRPAQEVGGDFFQILPLEGVDAGSTLILLGDVSGKGLKAAMAVSFIVGVARGLADDYPYPGPLLSQLNRRLYGRFDGGFATCIALRLDADGICTLSSAGHPPPFLNDAELALAGALPLGLVPKVKFEESTVQLEVADHMGLYTDGVLEARNEAGELFSFSRMEKLWASRPNADEATEAAVAFGQDDDITVLTLTRLATGLEPTAMHTATWFVGPPARRQQS